MKVFSHRANTNFRDVHPLVYGAEIDVHIDGFGQLEIKHDPDALVKYSLNEFFVNTKFNKFFVDIKQNLAPQYLRDIEIAFGHLLFGIFDVPMPAAYFAVKNNIPIYARLSEFEPANFIFNRFWVDPLGSQTVNVHRALMTSVREAASLIVACPSLHGHGLNTSLYVWDLIASSPLKNIDGIVTKYPGEAAHYFNV